VSKKEVRKWLLIDRSANEDERNENAEGKDKRR
jgi:hypothetical protein